MLQHSLISLKDYNETWVSISNQYWFASAQATPCTNIMLCSSCKQNLPNRFVLPELPRLSSENKTLFLPISERFLSNFFRAHWTQIQGKKKATADIILSCTTKSNEDSLETGNPTLYSSCSHWRQQAVQIQPDRRIRLISWRWDRAEKHRVKPEPS